VIVERVCIALMAVLVADVFLGVWSRYVMRATFQWYDEVARLCFVWMIFLGAALAVRRGGHFRLHLVIDRLGVTARRRVDIVVTLIVIAFAAVLVAGGIAIAPLARRQVTDSLEISMLWFYGALPVGGALMIVYALPQLWALLRGDSVAKK
jgi:TRAP-type C4-dicarboxylate transport system permease small subunit